MLQLLFSFNGRISRKPYWLYILCYCLMCGGLQFTVKAAEGGPGFLIFLLVIPILIVAVWASLAVSVKRWHDRDKSGWWVLIGLIPIVGSIWVLVETGFLKGTEGSNRFGEDPLK
jgi:uncharacterized membrane protein YhaH (DUF805 family)